ncbi:hypothetical protein XBFFL1_770093 [Xenorhabdus bovienii str. feltiae Florida]|nr:hypothetical protein XBFFR1_1910005 [Xenorhabdus bovienii str. feltiae France]CDG94609.1 hypothetical protein XBFFL1_770093 [Xenorhabdus bovienii str. feltiae Florida]
MKSHYRCHEYIRVTHHSPLLIIEPVPFAIAPENFTVFTKLTLSLRERKGRLLPRL